MGMYTPDADAKVRIEAEIGETKVSFSITGLDGAAFVPGREVYIAEDRIVALIRKLFAPMGFTEYQADGYRQPSDPHLHDAAGYDGR